MLECKWMKDGICVNEDCPMFCGNCPVEDEPGLCGYEEREEGARWSVDGQCSVCGEYDKAKNIIMEE